MGQPIMLEMIINQDAFSWPSGVMIFLISCVAIAFDRYAGGRFGLVIAILDVFGRSFGRGSGGEAISRPVVGLVNQAILPVYQEFLAVVYL